jgi:hypothetical protein
MTSARPPWLAVALLQRLGADPALVGDLLEQFEHRRSRLWFWRQVFGALPVLVSGRARDVQPHRPRSINLSVAPTGSAVGGVGLLAIAVLVTIVAPQMWWLGAVAIAGGVVLGTAMVLVGRLRQPPAGRRNLFVLVALLLASA